MLAKQASRQDYIKNLLVDKKHVLKIINSKHNFNID